MKTVGQMTEKEFDQLNFARDYYTESDRNIAEELEANELLREFLATEA